MDFQPIIDYIENILRKEKGLPCCDLRINQDHKLLFRHTSGYADYEGKTPLTSDNLYFMYSCTKPVTCAAALQLVERGVIGLDDPVKKYLPEFGKAFLLKDGKRIPPKNTMTLRHLFTMSAGLDYGFLDPHIKEAAAVPNATTQSIVNSFVNKALCFEPGDQYKYSLCHDVLAAVVEVASSERYSEYLKKNIFEPLGMKRTTFVVPPEEEHLLTAQYIFNKKTGEYTRLPLINNFQLSADYESGGAGICSCIEDYALFADAMACGGVGKTGAQILKPETINLMRTEQLSTVTRDPDSFSTVAGEGYGYGLGVRTLTKVPKEYRGTVGEFGWDGAAGSYIMIDPSNRLSIMFTMHVQNWHEIFNPGHCAIRSLTYEMLGL